ncbi:MAG: hypothetical protein ACRBFS_22945 [Aureispira sp.]
MRDKNYIVVCAGDSNGVGTALTDQSEPNIPASMTEYAGMTQHSVFSGLSTIFRLDKVPATNRNVNDEFIAVSGRNGNGYAFGLGEITAHQLALARQAEHGNNGKEVLYLGCSLSGDAITDTYGESTRYDLITRAIQLYPDDDVELVFIHVIGTNTEVDGTAGYTGAQFGEALKARCDMYDGWFPIKSMHCLVPPYPSGAVRIDKGQTGMNNLAADTTRPNITFLAGDNYADFWTTVETRANSYAGVSIDHNNLATIASRGGGSHYNAETVIAMGEVGAEKINVYHS